MTTDELRALRQADPDAYKSNIKRVVVDNDKPSAPGVWQGGGMMTVEMPISIPLGGAPDE